MALIRFYKPALYRKDMDAVLQTMVDEKIGPGERKKEFLRSFAAYIGKKDGIALRSYPDAIVAALHALGIEEGESVMISVLSPRIYLEAFRSANVQAGRAISVMMVAISVLLMALAGRRRHE